MAVNNRNLETQKFEIKKPYVIVCEGKDDFGFLDEYLKYLGKLNFIDKNSFKIIKANGVDNIAREMKNYKNYSDYDAMKGFLFVRDADNNPESAVNSMIGNINEVWNITLDKTGDFQTDSEGVKIGFFIFPGLDDSGNYRKGTLEDFCTEIFNFSNGTTQIILSLVDEHMKKLTDNNIIFKTPHKNKLHLCLDSTNDFLGDKIGESARKNAFDFSSDKFSVLKARIIDLTK